MILGNILGFLSCTVESPNTPTATYLSECGGNWMGGNVTHFPWWVELHLHSQISTLSPLMRCKRCFSRFQH
ncbi:hypothetical protein LINPERHAP1_LOCUS30181 [Linum perenne]